MTSPDLPDADEWAEEDEWQKLAEELGALPPRTSEHTPQGSPSHWDVPSPSAVEPSPHLPARAHAEESSPGLPTGNVEEDTTVDAGPRPGQISDQAEHLLTEEGGPAPSSEADIEAEQDEENEVTRKRRRRRRRRRKGGGETAQEPAPTLSTNASAETPDTEELEEIGGSVSDHPTAAHTLDWNDTTDPDQAAEVLRDILTHWNVPSWDEIVAGLYRPER
jgi:hypothetical protein